jgi:hypothetical protein
MIAIMTAATAAVFDIQLEKNGPSCESFLVTRMTVVEIIIEAAITINKVIKCNLLSELFTLGSMRYNTC